MNRFWFAVAAAVVLSASAHAQTPAVTWTQFTDPTENAFGFEVPQGWTVKGGVARFSPLTATPWLTAVSPDGGTQMFVGDPSLSGFAVPKANQAEGGTLPPLNAMLKPAVLLRYRPGAEFAEAYGPMSLAAANCTGAALVDTQPMPDVASKATARANAQAKAVGFPPSQQESGLATFTCQNAGRSLSAGVIATTTDPTGVGSFWGAGVAGYLTQPGQEASALAILDHIIMSEQWNPQWDAAMLQEFRTSLSQQIAANQQISDQMMAQARQQDQMESDMLRNQANANQAALTANHNAFMAQMGQQSAARNAQFNSDMAAKSLNAWKFNAYVRNGNVYQNPTTGNYYEVDH